MKISAHLIETIVLHRNLIYMTPVVLLCAEYPSVFLRHFCRLPRIFVASFAAGMHPEHCPPILCSERDEDESLLWLLLQWSAQKWVQTWRFRVRWSAFDRTIIRAWSISRFYYFEGCVLTHPCYRFIIRPIMPNWSGVSRNDETRLFVRVCVRRACINSVYNVRGGRKLYDQWCIEFNFK